MYLQALCLLLECVWRGVALQTTPSGESLSPSVYRVSAELALQSSFPSTEEQHYCKIAPHRECFLSWYHCRRIPVKTDTIPLIALGCCLLAPASSLISSKQLVSLQMYAALLLLQFATREHTTRD